MAYRIKIGKREYMVGTISKIALTKSEWVRAKTRYVDIMERAKIEIKRKKQKKSKKRRKKK